MRSAPRKKISEKAKHFLFVSLEFGSSLSLFLPNTCKEDRRKDGKGKLAIMAVLAFKVTATAWSSFLIYVLALRFSNRLLKR
jgi:hypothetical protein